MSVAASGASEPMDVDENPATTTFTCDWNNEKIQLELSSSTTIAEIRNMLQDQTGVPAKRQKFAGLKIRGGGRLDDTTTVGSLKSMKKNTFKMIGTRDDELFSPNISERRPFVLDDFKSKVETPNIDNETVQQFRRDYEIQQAAKQQGDYEQALALKEQGNAFFKERDYKKALKFYTRVFMHIGMNPCMNLSNMVGAGGGQEKTGEEEVNPSDQLRLATFLNIAAVYSKMERWEDVIEKCDRVLQHDQSNQKALFRRGSAHRHLGNYEAAERDLNEAKNINADPSIERELRLVDRDRQNDEKEFLRQMKKKMRNQQKKNKKKKKAQKKKAKAAAAAAQSSSAGDPTVAEPVEEDPEQPSNIVHPETVPMENGSKDPQSGTAGEPMTVDESDEDTPLQF